MINEEGLKLHYNSIITGIQIVYLGINLSAYPCDVGYTFVLFLGFNYWQSHVTLPVTKSGMPKFRPLLKILGAVPCGVGLTFTLYLGTSRDFIFQHTFFILFIIECTRFDPRDFGCAKSDHQPLVRCHFYHHPRPLNKSI